MVKRTIRRVIIEEIFEEDDAGSPSVVDQNGLSGNRPADPATMDIVAVQPASIETARLRFGALSSYFKK